MSIHMTVVASLLASAALPASAQTFTGGSINGEYREFTGDDVEGNSFTLDAGGDISVGADIGFGANISFGRNDEDLDYANGTVHGYYVLSPTAAIGLFAAADSIDGDDAALYGVEVGGRSPRGRYEVFYGVTDVEDPFDGDDLTIFGASFEFAIGNGFALGLQYESFTGLPGVTTEGEILNDTTFSDTALMVRYNITPEASIYAEYGSLLQSAFEDGVSFSSEDDTNYIGIGAEFALGERGGNIFGARSLAGFGF
ncbi:hypothetical protein [Yoonia sp. 2307UL14-13]|uniref:hypothetical protein n=1 Tax=Yoonia sp. 2307UL14-13 TaxID=3126506 RepID=UPI00309A8297